MENKSKVKISPEVLVSYGCVNCIWKSHGSCVYPGNEPSSGICDEYTDFLYSFDDGSGSVNALFEKFNLYLTELENLDGYNRMKDLGRDIEDLEKAGNADPELMRELEIRRHTHRVWWVTLNKQVLGAYGRIVDRDSKKKGADEGNRRVSIQQLETFMKTHIDELEVLERKQLEELPAKTDK